MSTWTLARALEGGVTGVGGSRDELAAFPERMAVTSE